MIVGWLGFRDQTFRFDYAVADNIVARILITPVPIELARLAGREVGRALHDDTATDHEDVSIRIAWARVAVVASKRRSRLILQVGASVIGFSAAVIEPLNAVRTSVANAPGGRNCRWQA